MYVFVLIFIHCCIKEIAPIIILNNHFNCHSTYTIIRKHFRPIDVTIRHHGDQLNVVS